MNDDLDIYKAHVVLSTVDGQVHLVYLMFQNLTLRISSVP